MSPDQLHPLSGDEVLPLGLGSSAPDAMLAAGN